jgi:hypothetical protein
MEGRMALFHGNKCAPACCTNFSTSRQRAIDRRSIACGLHNFRREENRRVCRSGAQKFDRIISRHRARRPVFGGFVHQMPGRCPVAVTIEQCADDSAIKDSGKSFIARLRPPFRDDFVAARKAPNPQSIRIRRAATPAGIGRGVSFLQGLRFSIRHRSLRSVRGRARIGS